MCELFISKDGVLFISASQTTAQINVSLLQDQIQLTVMALILKS